MGEKIGFRRWCYGGGICEAPDILLNLFLPCQFYKIEGEILEAKAEQKIYASFHCVRGLGYMTVSEMLKAMQG